MSEHLTQFIYRISDQVIYKDRESYTPEDVQFISNAGLLSVGLLSIAELDAIDQVHSLTGTPDNIVSYLMTGTFQKDMSDTKLHSPEINHFLLYLMSALNVADIATATQESREQVDQNIQNVIGLLQRTDMFPLPTEMMQRKVKHIKRHTLYADLIHLNIPHVVVKKLIRGDSPRVLEPLPQPKRDEARKILAKYKIIRKYQKRPVNR